MSEKRRGLGRGLGALIPSGSPTTPRPPGDRPIDVFFPGKQATATAVIDAPGAPAETQGAPEAEAQPAAEVVAPGADAAAGAQDATSGASAQSEDTEVTDSEVADSDLTDTASPDTVSGAAERVATEPTATVDTGATESETSDADTAAPEPVSRETTPGAPSTSISATESPDTVDVRDSAPATVAPQHGGAVSDPAAWGDAPVVQNRSSNGADPAGGADPEPLGPVSRETTRPQHEVELVPVPGARFAELPVGQITPNPKQPRTVFDEEAMAELVHSIREIGVLQPIVVRPVDPVDGEPRYELIMGERRWRATQEAGLDVVPAIVRETQDDDLLRDALLENLHRSQLNPLEEAAAYSQLLEDFGCTHEDLATRIGRSRPQISNTLRLLRLPPLVQRRVAAGVLSAGHARALLALEDGAAMERLAQRIVAEGLSVRSVEEIVAMGDGDIAPAPRRPRAGGRSPELDDLASRLSDRLDTRVKIALGRSKGRLTVEFASVEDLNRILGVIAPQENGAFRGSVED